MRLTVEGCRERQRQLAGVLAEVGLDGAVISRREHVYYFTGFLHNRYHAAAALVDRRGRTILVRCGVVEDEVAADEIIPYEADAHATMHSRQFETVAERLGPAVGSGIALGSDLGGGIACIAALGGGDVVDLTREMYRLRKRKHPDEVEALRAAIAVTDAMYTAAREAVGPGADEVEAFAHIRARATRAAGEDLEHFGNDYRANDLGGAPRHRAMRAGELYILDAGPSLHGYFADNCRTFAVDGSPTDAQMTAWERLDGLFGELEASVHPGVRAADVYAIADGRLRGDGFEGLIHHLGHGVGLAPHETPELNPEYEATFEVGDVFTMEPGLYGEELRAGIRLEENYLLAEDGLEQLTSFPRNLS